MTSLHVERRLGAVTITAQTYVLEVRADPPEAILAASDGQIWSRLSLLASVDRVDAADESYAVVDPVVRETDGVVEVVVEMASSAWDDKQVRLRCATGSIALDVTVHGAGTLADLTLLGGRAIFPNGACGWFASSIEYASVFVPGPTEPVQVVRPAATAAVLSVVGDAGAGRLHGIFSPPPLCLVLGRKTAGGATDVPVGDWLALAVRASVAEQTFTELRYLPIDGGFSIQLEYDGHTSVREAFTSPTIVLWAAADPWQALVEHRGDLVARGLAPESSAHVAATWWSEPIFCGWGEQCARAPLPGPATHPYHLAALEPAALPADVTIAPDLARQDVYDDALAQLATAGVVPGTIVIDDRWQSAYGTAHPDPDRWPDLRGWIADRHAAGQRVLLWWKAWDHSGIPVEECVVDRDGRPVSVDPGNAAYRRRLTDIVTELVGLDGLDADGFKVDFTQRAPAGRSLRAATDGSGRPSWGIAGLHDLLATLYRAAKAAKPDALVVTHTPHPGFADVCDMVRLNDVLERDSFARVVPVVDQLQFRQKVVRAVMPHHVVDTDQWPMPSRAEWRRYVDAQAELGVPALYYATAIDRSGETLTADDLAMVARSWDAYRRRVQGGRHDE